MSITNVIQEVWERVPGFEDLYEVSDQGRVRALDTGRIKERSTKKDGQVSVCLHGASQGIKTKHTQVKLIVLAAFVGPRPEGLVACNMDGDRDNCALSNLKYVTLGEARMVAQATRPRQPRLNRFLFADLQAEALASGASVIECAAARGIREDVLRNYVKQRVMKRVRAKGKTESKGLGANYVGA